MNADRENARRRRTASLAEYNRQRCEIVVASQFVDELMAYFRSYDISTGSAYAGTVSCIRFPSDIDHDLIDALLKKWLDGDLFVY